MPDLFPYQHVGADWLAARKRAYLADRPGLGKSAQTVTAADRAGYVRGLVISPAFLRSNWVNEFRKFGALDRRVASWDPGLPCIPDCDVLCISYEMSTSPKLAKWWRDLPGPKFLVCDEAHMLKNRAAKRTRAVFGKMCRGDGLMGSADACWLLSGTPMLGSADELWPWMRAFGLWDRGYWDFAERFTKFAETPWGRKITGNKNPGDLRKLMAPALLRRKEEDVELELPPLVVTSRVVDPIELSPLNENLKELEHIEELLRANVGSVSDLYKVGFPPDFGKKFVGGEDRVLSARRTLGLLKVRGYVSLARHELSNYREHHDGQRLDKLVVFAIHKVVIDYLRELLAEFHPRVIYGGTPMKSRDSILEQFNDPLGRCRLLICNIKAAGVGLNITGARHVDILEPSWVPAENEQAVKRLHRIGQRGTVRARYIGLAATMDEHITNVLAEKTRRISEILD